MAEPSVYDQAQDGSGAAKALLEEVETAADYTVNVVERMVRAVLYGVDDASSDTGLRNLPEDQAGAIVGALRTLTTLLVNVDTAVAKITDQPTVGSMPREQWPVRCP